MDFLSPIKQIGMWVWQLTMERSVHVRELKDNLVSLEGAMEQLKEQRDDVKTAAEQAERRHKMLRTRQVSGWLGRVEEVEAEVSQLLREGKEEDGLELVGVFFPKNCWSSYKIGKKVSDMIVEVDKLKKEGHFDVLVNQPACDVVEEICMEETVGLDLKIAEVWEKISDRRIGVIGLVGGGGVGKTTLLKGINNEFCYRSHDFDVVIFVFVSKEMNVEEVQEVVRKRLEIPNNMWENRNDRDRANEIYKVLKHRKFVLLLDDIWQRFELAEVGIPFPSSKNGSKVLFTTRSEEVCGQMKADHLIRVGCLTSNEALDLFQKMVGQDVVNSSKQICQIVESVAKQCKGLPLALVTIGQAMARRKGLHEWRHAWTTLKRYPSKLAGMEDRVFPILQFSYDNLSNDTLKKCFLYCSLFPKESYIKKEDLINLWIGEGFLGDEIHDARNEGEFIIASLKLTSLLETVETVDALLEAEDFVQMHDMIRDMALWYACERNNNEGKTLVQDIGRLAEGKPDDKVERISLWGPNITAVYGMLNFPNLVSFYLRKSYVTAIPTDFFQNVPMLRVLDLSNNTSLAKLPVGIGKLTNLRYLNISWTLIEELPTEIMNLIKLKVFLMDHTGRLRTVPEDVIPSLSSLEVFSRLTANSTRNKEFDEVALLDDLERLEQINDITITLTTLGSVEKFLNCQKLQKSTRELGLSGCYQMSSVEISSPLEHLEKLSIMECNSLQELKVKNTERIRGFDYGYVATGHQYFGNLRCVKIWRCPIKCVTWLVYAPSLCVLKLIECDQMEEVITCDGAYAEIEAREELFSNLTELELIDLCSLNSIVLHALPFPSLIRMRITGCLNLKKLPFDLETAKTSLKKIEGERHWWNELQWENEDIKHAFSSKFVHLKTKLSQMVEIKEKLRVTLYVQKAVLNFIAANRLYGTTACCPDWRSSDHSHGGV